MTTWHFYEEPGKRPHAGLKSAEHHLPVETTCKASKPGAVTFHNPSPAGAAQKRDQTHTECLRLPAPEMGSKF